MEKIIGNLKIICEESPAKNFAIKHIEMAIEKVGFSETCEIFLIKTSDLSEQEYKTTIENYQFLFNQI